MTKLPLCNRCQFFSSSPYLVCSLHPNGPSANTCDDFSAADAEDSKCESIGGGYYAGDWIPQHFPIPSRTAQLVLLDTHPLFTGRCPRCETPIADSKAGEWRCSHCNWTASEH